MLLKVRFQNDLIAVLKKYYEDIAVFVYGVTVVTPDKGEGKGLEAFGNTLIPVPPRDDEENTLRDDCAKKVTELTVRLTENVYLTR